MIVLALSCIAYIMVTFFATYAYFTLREQSKKISFIKGAVREMSVMMMAKRVKENFEEVEKMKATLQMLISTEQYEEAERFKKFIEEAENTAQKSLKNFQDLFKDSSCKLFVTDIKQDEE